MQTEEPFPRIGGAVDDPLEAETSSTLAEALDGVAPLVGEEDASAGVPLEADGHTAWVAPPVGEDVDCGGELLLYVGVEPKKYPTHIAPVMGRLVVFLSEDTAHEVLPALRTRHSIAGWFRCGAT